MDRHGVVLSIVSESFAVEAYPIDVDGRLANVEEATLVDV